MRSSCDDIEGAVLLSVILFVSIVSCLAVMMVSRHKLFMDQIQMDQAYYQQENIFETAKAEAMEILLDWYQQFNLNGRINIINPLPISKDIIINGQQVRLTLKDAQSKINLNYISPLELTLLKDKFGFNDAFNYYILNWLDGLLIHSVNLPHNKLDERALGYFLQRHTTLLSSLISPLSLNRFQYVKLSSLLTMLPDPVSININALTEPLLSVWVNQYYKQHAEAAVSCIRAHESIVFFNQEQWQAVCHLPWQFKFTTFKSQYYLIDTMMLGSFINKRRVILVKVVERNGQLGMHIIWETS